MFSFPFRSLEMPGGITGKIRKMRNSDGFSGLVAYYFQNAVPFGCSWICAYENIQGCRLKAHLKYYKSQCLGPWGETEVSIIPYSKIMWIFSRVRSYERSFKIWFLTWTTFSGAHILRRNKRVQTIITDCRVKFPQS